ncbi:MAG: flavodoxin [Mobilitalea sp.]
MMKISIIYWSSTGNTQSMAKYIKEGAIEAGAEVNLKEVSSASSADIDYDVVVLGCPSMGDEELEDGEFAPFLDSIEASLAGKKVALFGSYDWGDGQWMRDWDKRMIAAGVTLVTESLIVNLTPEGDECRAFGKALVQ